MPDVEDALRDESEEQKQFEALFADLPARFVRVASEDLDAEIEDARRRIG